MSAYYNENNKFAAAWLRNLIAAGHIAPGDVDERSILDVRADDLKSYKQCHFFAGIGAWSYALRRAGWDDDRPVWSGSCPCQPFSLAGAGAGFDDERHLWPAWFSLIRERRPAAIFGEQVASALPWLDLVQDDLEGEGYAFGAADLCAAGVRSPHIRQRLFWVADADRWERIGEPGSQERQPDRQAPGREQGHGRSPHGGARHNGPAPGCFWDGCEWVETSDGRWRPIEPQLEPLDHGTPGRVGRLRAYGNAIVPDVAAAFVTAYLSA